MTSPPRKVTWNPDDSTEQKSVPPEIPVACAICGGDLKWPDGQVHAKVCLKCFGKLASTSQYAPLTEDQSRVLLSLMMQKQLPDGKNIIETIGKKMEEDGVFPYMVIKKRLAVFEEELKPLSMSTDAAIFLSLLGKSPGELVIMMVECFEKASAANQTVVDLDFVVTHVYPMGFYTKAAFEQVWDQRKEADKTVGFNWLI